MTTVTAPSHPLRVLIIKTLTLPDVSEDERAMITEAAGPNATVTVVDGFQQAMQHIADADVVLGILPKALLEAGPELRWVHATASGVDMFMYDEFLESGIVLTGEKGLVGGHLADTAMQCE